MQKGGATVELIKNLMNAIHYVDSHLTQDISVEDVASQAYMSVSHFQRVFHVVTGITVGEYIRNRRLSQARAGHAASQKQGYRYSDAVPI